MEIPDQLQCLFSGHVRERDGSYIVEVPEEELQEGSIRAGETYRVALIPQSEDEKESASTERAQSPSEPPVEEGETRDVDIEDIGEQGDGITRVERGFVVIVPETEQGERVTVEITEVRENVAFAEVVERRDHFG